MDEFDRYAGALRFSFAHEVGHLVLHRNTYERFVFSSVEEYKEFIGNFPDEDHFDFEYQANEFAGRLLVPREALAKELRKAYERISENESLISMARDNPDVVLNRITPTLRKPFGVSDDVIRKRIEREGLALPRW